MGGGKRQIEGGTLGEGAEWGGGVWGQSEGWEEADQRWDLRKGQSEGRDLRAEWGVEPPSPGNIKVSASGMAEPGAPGTDGSWRPEHRASGV